MKLIDLFPKSPILIAQADSPGGNLTRLVDLAPLPHADAIELFAATLNLPANQIDHIAVDSICTLLQNLPLAVVTVWMMASVACVTGRASSGARRQVFVIGTLHRMHLDARLRYSLADLRAEVAELRPDLVCAEVTP